MSLIKDQNEIISYLRNKLELYRSVGHYTVNALELATDDLEGELHNVSDSELYEKRRAELYGKLNEIRHDLENH